MIRRPPRSTPLYSSAASDVYKRQRSWCPNRGKASCREGLRALGEPGRDRLRAWVPSAVSSTSTRLTQPRWTLYPASGPFSPNGSWTGAPNTVGSPRSTSSAKSLASETRSWPRSDRRPRSDMAAEKAGVTGRVVADRNVADGTATDQTAIDARLLVPALLAWIAVATMLSLRPLVLMLIAAAFAGLGVVVMHHRWRRRSWVTSTAVTLLATALALLATAAHSSVREAGLVPGLAAQRAMATIEAVIVTDPRVVICLLY